MLENRRNSLNGSVLIVKSLVSEVVAAGERPLRINHGLKVKTDLKAGTGGERCRPPCGVNHGLKVKTDLKAGTGGERCRPPCGVNHGLAIKHAKSDKPAPKSTG